MSYSETVLIEIIGAQSQRFTVSGPGMGQEGVELSRGPQGLHDEAPIKTIWQQSAFQEGATFIDYTIEPLDLVLAFDVVGDEDNWQEIDALFYSCFDPVVPAQIVVTSETGTRILSVTKLEASKTTSDRDPRILGWSHIVFTLRAAWPFWQGDTDTHTVTISGSGTSYLTVENPTDRPLWPQWALTAPGRWTIPDFSFQDDGNQNRTITTPTLSAGQDLTIDTYPLHESYVAADRSNIAGRFGGIEFQHPIPPRTPPTKIPISLTGGTTTSTAQLRLVHQWQRPW